MSEREKPRKRSLAGSVYEESEGSPGFLFWKTFNSWSRAIRAALVELELTQVQYSILAATSYLLSNGEHITQQNVAQQLSMDKMMVSDVVKTLEKRGLLKRGPHPTDGRAICLTLTPEGKKLLKRAVPVVERADEAFFSGLDQARRREFIGHLQTLIVDAAASV